MYRVALFGGLVGGVVGQESDRNVVIRILGDQGQFIRIMSPGIDSEPTQGLSGVTNFVSQCASVS